MIVVDTPVIVAYMNSADDHHEAVGAWLEAAADDLATTPLIVAEVDHLVSTRGGGRAAVSALRADLAAGSYLIDWWQSAITSCVSVAERYADIGLGLADASLVALAERLDTTTIATLDERHFRVVRPLSGGAAFRLLPADA